MEDEPDKLSDEARQAGADCELKQTLVASFDAASITRKHEKVTSFCVGAGGKQHSGMSPVGVCAGGDDESEIRQSFGSSPAPGVPSLCQQLAALKPYAIDLPAKYFNRAKLWFSLRLAVVVDQPAMAAIMGKGNPTCLGLCTAFLQIIVVGVGSVQRAKVSVQLLTDTRGGLLSFVH